jgi:hypothetical protein
MPVATAGETRTSRPPLDTITITTGKAPVAAPPARKPAAATAVEAEDFSASFGLGDQLSDLSESVRTFTSKLAGALKDAASDILSLEIKTYITEDLNAVAGGDDSQARLCAMTRIEFDGDMEVYVPVRTDEVDDKLWQIHLDMVKEAQANRAQFLTAMAELATNLLKNLG